MVETLNDFLKLQEKQKSDIDEFEGLCLSMPLDLLAQAFSLNPLTRRFYVKAWMDALGQALHKKLKLTAGEENEAPYMLEEGVLTLPKGIYSKPGLLFISLVHESSHFILTSSPNVWRITSSGRRNPSVKAMRRCYLRSNITRIPFLWPLWKRP